MYGIQEETVAQNAVLRGRNNVTAPVVVTKHAAITTGIRAWSGVQKHYAPLHHTAHAEAMRIHVIPQEFVLDDQDGIHDPVGMSGIRFEARIHIITMVL